MQRRSEAGVPVSMSTTDLHRVHEPLISMTLCPGHDAVCHVDTLTFNHDRSAPSATKNTRWSLERHVYTPQQSPGLAWQHRVLAADVPTSRYEERARLVLRPNLTPAGRRPHLARHVGHIWLQRRIARDICLQVPAAARCCSTPDALWPDDTGMERCTCISPDSGAFQFRVSSA
jgi:hypothetical protein